MNEGAEGIDMTVEDQDERLCEQGMRYADRRVLFGDSIGDHNNHKIEVNTWYRTVRKPLSP